MSPYLTDRIFRRAGAFVREARKRGVQSRAAKTLESAASEISPEDPARILSSRELFEQAATRAVVGEGGNLELSFELVDMLASTVETLGLARSSDVPDPFRRVWVTNAAGHRSRGVVLTNQGGEVAVFCPPSAQGFFEIDSVLRLCYRGFSSSVSYNLQLNDAVRLPGTVVLHFTRSDGPGAIGRKFQRCPVNLQARVRALLPGDDGDYTDYAPCEVANFSLGGLAISCAILYEQGQKVCTKLFLPGETDVPFITTAEICWTRGDAENGYSYGLRFTGLTDTLEERLARFVKSLSHSLQD